MRKILLAFAILAGLTAPAFAQPKTIPALTPLGTLTGAETVPACTTVPCGSTTTQDIADLAPGTHMPAGSNLVFQVTTTGNDANPCTTLSPCLTIQHTVLLAEKYDYQNLYQPTINVAGGSYVETNGVELSQLINCPAGGVITGNQTTWTNVVVDGNNNGNNGVFLLSGINSSWTLSGMRVTNAGNLFSVFGHSSLTIDEINFAFNDNTFNGIDVGAYGAVGETNTTSYSVTETGTGTTHNAFIVTSDAGNGTAVFQGPTVITFTNAIIFDHWADSVDYSNVQMLGNITNPTNLTIATQLFFADVFSNIDFGAAWLALTVPTLGAVDASSILQGFPVGQQVSGPPTTSNLAISQQWGVFKDTTQGPGLGITLKYNDAGTLYDVGPGAIATGSPPTLTGTCTTASQVGANTAGTFTATCVAQTVIITFATTAPNGWTCNAHDLSTPTDALNQTATSATSCTLTGTTVASDRISFNAVGF
jgi:hypothetical protein